VIEIYEPEHGDQIYVRSSLNGLQLIGMSIDDRKVGLDNAK